MASDDRERRVNWPLLVALAELTEKGISIENAATLMATLAFDVAMEEFSPSEGGLRLVLVAESALDVPLEYDLHVDQQRPGGREAPIGSILRDALAELGKQGATMEQSAGRMAGFAVQVLAREVGRRAARRLVNGLERAVDDAIETRGY